MAAFLGDYAFTDLGLNPENWKKVNEHIFYSTSGNNVMVKPEEGYSLQFTDEKTGKQQHFYTSLNGTWFIP